MAGKASQHLAGIVRIVFIDDVSQPSSLCRTIQATKSAGIQVISINSRTTRYLAPDQRDDSQQDGMELAAPSPSQRVDYQCRIRVGHALSG